MMSIRQQQTVPVPVPVPVPRNRKPNQTIVIHPLLQRMPIVRRRLLVQKRINPIQNRRHHYQPLPLLFRMNRHSSQRRSLRRRLRLQLRMRQYRHPHDFMMKPNRK
jgi:hypothetical protein